MDDLTPDATKASIAPVIRLTWESSGDKVFVYDGASYLGELDVTLKNGDARNAYLTGTILARRKALQLLAAYMQAVSPRHRKSLTGRSVSLWLSRAASSL